jgi:hypothetical protein
MYCAALTAGVPFMNYSELQRSNRDVANALAPTDEAQNILKSYYNQTNITPAPVEDMLCQQMSHYHTYRYQARHDPVNHSSGKSYIMRSFYQKSGDVQTYLRDSQQAFIAILASLNRRLLRLMDNEDDYTDYVPQPYLGTAPTKPASLYKNAKAALSDLFDSGPSDSTRTGVLIDYLDDGSRDKAAHQLPKTLVAWRQWLKDTNSPELVDADAPERDILSVARGIQDAPLPEKIVEFFDLWVHDSVAGLHKDGMHEFLFNGIGIAKFRRIYFGDRGDAMLQEAAKAANKQRESVASQNRARKKQWEAQELARTRPSSY